MKKINNFRKLVTRIATGILFVLLLVINLQINMNNSGGSHLSLSHLALGLFTTAVAATGGRDCTSCCYQPKAICVTPIGNVGSSYACDCDD
jgi:hypothetical protein